MKTPRFARACLLADELAEPLRAQRGFGDVLVAALGTDEAAGRLLTW